MILEPGPLSPFTPPAAIAAGPADEFVQAVAEDQPELDALDRAIGDTEGDTAAVADFDPIAWLEEPLAPAAEELGLAPPGAEYLGDADLAAVEVEGNLVAMSEETAPEAFQEIPGPFVEPGGGGTFVPTDGDGDGSRPPGDRVA